MALSSSFLRKVGERLLLACCLSVFVTNAISQRKFEGWYRYDASALLKPPEARIAALSEKAKKYRKAGIEAGFLRTVGQIVASHSGDKRVLSSAVKLLTEFGNQNDCELAANLTTDYLAWYSPEASVFSDRSTAKSCLLDHIGAFEDLSRALELAPDDFDLMHRRLLILYSVEPVEAALPLYRIAIEHCERMIATNPITIFRYKNVLSNAYRGRSEVYRKLGNRTARLADLTLAIDYSYGKNSPYHLERSRAFREYKMYEEALADFNSYMQYLVETRRFSGVEYVQRAMLNAEAGRFSDAISDYLIAAEKLPQNRYFYQARIDELRLKLP